MTSVADRVRAAIEKGLGRSAETLSPDMRFVEDLHADSLDLIELRMDIEDAFDLWLDDDDVTGLDTVGELVAFVEAKVGPARRAGPDADHTGEGGE